MIRRLIHLARAHHSGLRRALWLSILLSHAPALLRRSGQIFEAPAADNHIGTFIVLLLGSVFFILKILDVPAFRFKTDFRSVAIVGVAFALIHWHMLPGVAENSPQARGTMIVSELLLGSALVCTRRMIQRLLDRVRAIRWAPLRPRLHAWSSALDVLPALRRIVAGPLIPRSPPPPQRV